MLEPATRDRLAEAKSEREAAAALDDAPKANGTLRTARPSLVDI